MLQSNFYDKLREAQWYDMLSCSYKYVNPELSMDYYRRHYDIVSSMPPATRYGYNGGGYPQQRQTALIRMLHAVPNGSAVDIYVDGHKVFNNIRYKENSEYVEFPSGQHRITVYPTNQTANPMIDQTTSLASDQVYSFGIIGMPGSVQLFGVIDKPDVQQGQSKLRFVHYSPDAPAVAIQGPQGYLWYQRIPYKGVTGYQTVNPGTFDLTVLDSGSNNALLNINNLSLDPNTAYTVYIVGLTQGSPELEAWLVKDGTERFAPMGPLYGYGGNNF